MNPDVTTREQMQPEIDKLEAKIKQAITELMSIVDGSNWPEEAQSGVGYELYSGITEQLHDVIAGLQGD